MSLAYKGNRGQGPSLLLHHEVHIMIVPDLVHTAALQEGVAVGLRTTGVHLLARASLVQRLQVLPGQTAAPSPLPLLPARSMTGVRLTYTHSWPTGLADVLISTSLIQLWLLAFTHTVAPPLPMPVGGAVMHWWAGHAGYMRYVTSTSVRTIFNKSSNWFTRFPGLKCGKCAVELCDAQTCMVMSPQCLVTNSSSSRTCGDTLYKVRTALVHL